MRVLIENNAYAPSVTGGAEMSVQGIAEGLVQRGHDVWVLTAAERDAEDELHGVRVMRRRFAALMSYPEHRASTNVAKKALNKPLVIDNPRNARVMDDAIRRAHPDVVLSNNLLGVTPEFWRAAKRAGLPIMHTARDYALMCPNSVLMCGRRQECDRPLPHCALMRWHLRRTCELVDVISAASRYALDEHLRRGYFPHARTSVIPNAIAFDEHEVDRAVRFREKAGVADALRVCFLGRIIEEKGLLVLLDALRFLWDQGIGIELHLGGRGPLEPKFLALADEGLPIHLHGFLEGEDVDRLLLGSDVLVAPSLCAETFGRVVLDAYAHAMPAIVSDAGALPEVLSPQAGVVVPAGSKEALADALLSYARDPALLRRQGAVGASMLRSHSVEQQAVRFEAELERLVRSDRGRDVSVR